MANVTHGLSVTESATVISLANDETSIKMRWAFYFVIFPMTSLVGIAANVTSSTLIVRKGFTKGSNVLLISLALSDITFLVGLNSFPRNVIFVSVPHVLQFSEIANYIFYINYLMFSMFYTVGLHCSMMIPVLITGERLLAIFIPLTFTRVVTPIRTMVAVSWLITIAISGFIYYSILCVGFSQVTVHGISVGLFYFTERYYNDVRSGFYQTFLDFINYTTGTAPIVLVMLGSAVFGVKVIAITNNRRQLTSATTTNKQSSNKLISRTSKTLFSICILYLVCSGFGFVIEYITRIPGLNNQSLIIVLDLYKDLLMSINSIGNFIIYVSVNKTIRNTKIRVRTFTMTRCISMSTL